MDDTRITVGDLRKTLVGIPDDVTITLSIDDYSVGTDFAHLGGISINPGETVVLFAGEYFASSDPATSFVPGFGSALTTARAAAILNDIQAAADLPNESTLQPDGTCVDCGDEGMPQNDAGQCPSCGDEVTL